jgi:hypothetical protein
LTWIKKKAQENIQYYITQRIPLEIEQAFVTLDFIMRQSVEMLDKTEDDRLKISLLGLIKDIERARVELLADTTIANEIVRDYKQRQEKLLGKQNNDDNSLLPNDSKLSEAELEVEEFTDIEEAEQGEKIETEE